MPFCTQCGSQVLPADQFCGRCGAGQSAGAAAAPTPAVGLLENMTPRTASMLCYIPYVGWIGAILVLSTTKFRYDRTVRFHAFQGLYLFVAWLILYLVVQPALAFSPAGQAGSDFASLGQFIILVAWVWMIIKTAKEELFRLPVIGELADRSVAEQR